MTEYKYPYEPFEQPAEKLLSSEFLRGFLSGYAMGCSKLTTALTKEPMSYKSYDPLTVDNITGTIHSYTFNLKDGGRHHPIADYKTIGEITSYILKECEDIIND